MAINARATKGQRSIRLLFFNLPESIDVSSCVDLLAHEQGTFGLELRAAVSLARLLGKLGRFAEARDLLAPVYGRFTEGF